MIRLYHIYICREIFKSHNTESRVMTTGLILFLQADFQESGDNLSDKTPPTLLKCGQSGLELNHFRFLELNNSASKHSPAAGGQILRDVTESERDVGN
jgi:hypothetical protein